MTLIAGELSTNPTVGNTRLLYKSVKESDSPAKFLGGEVISWLYQLRNRLQRIWSYLPVLWKIYDFDWTSAFYVLEHQLGRLEYCIRNGNHANQEHHAKQIQIVRECLRRLAEDNLAPTEFEAWSKAARLSDDDFFERLNKPRTPEQKRALKELMDKEAAVKEQLEELLFKTLKRNYRSWWD